MKHWENKDYQIIETVQLVNDTIHISFKNGDSVTLLVERLLPPGFVYNDDEVLLDADNHIVIPTKNSQFLIPWDKIRILTDSKFGEFMAAESEKYAKRIGSKLRAIREKKGIKNIELANRSGLTPQTITRIEKGQTDVSFTTLSKILGAMGSTLVDLSKNEIEEVGIKTFQSVLSRINEIGLNKAFVLSKIIPSQIQNKIQEYEGDVPSLLIDETVSYLSYVFGWTDKEFWENKKLSVSEIPIKLAYFKKPSKTNEKQIKAYSHYVYFLAKTVIKAYREKPILDFPTSKDDFVKQYSNNYEELNVSNLISYTWDLGVCILPLDDIGIFHGACWNINNKNIIVLKQKNNSHARWLFDLLHELYHVFAHLSSKDTAIIEQDEITPFSEINDEETEANVFANQVLFGDNFARLPEECVDVAKWDIRKLKSAIPIVAERNKIRTDALANLVAFRLGNQNQNWWGTANGFQTTEPKPYDIAVRELIQRIDNKFLSNFESNLLEMAINSI